MKKKLLVLALVAVVAGLVFGGCSFDREHNRAVRKSWRKNMTEFHEDFDYYFLDYDPYDPWKN